MSSASWQPSGLHSSFSQFGFEHWWSMDGEWVEEPNHRRGGESGVKLLPPLQPGQRPLYCKRQIGHLFRSWCHPFGLPTVLREQQALLITEELSGFVSLVQWYAEHAPKLDETSRKAVLRRLALVLQRPHRSRRQHGSLYGKHIYISLTANVPEVALLDLEKSRIRLLRSKAQSHDLSQLRRRRGEMPEADWNYLLECYHNPQLECQVATHEA
ncbi:lipopolysaccharide kinase InaA family protein [Pseudomonas sp. gcc21]|uniref:lipopolysaccharide kinase InaA family protein n=1 Tax=Pseudomonas sp. gcc21 TaxID=2726989 RepID=UPI0021143796|nr:lipopolysaccharide kinase InaA family protein [Pseudomonas sp. gcc21]